MADRRDSLAWAEPLCCTTICRGRYFPVNTLTPDHLLHPLESCTWWSLIPTIHVNTYFCPSLYLNTFHGSGTCTCAHLQVWCEVQKPFSKSGCSFQHNFHLNVWANGWYIVNWFSSIFRFIRMKLAPVGRTWGLKSEVGKGHQCNISKPFAVLPRWSRSCPRPPASWRRRRWRRWRCA